MSLTYAGALNSGRVADALLLDVQKIVGALAVKLG